MATATTNDKTIEVTQKSLQDFQTGVDNLNPQPTPVKVDNQVVQDNQLIDPNSGQVSSKVPGTPLSQGGVSTAKTPEEISAALVNTFKSQPGVTKSLEELKAAFGQLSPEAQAAAAQMNPSQLAQLGLDAAQIAEAQKVIAPPDRTVQEGELIDGSAVDQGKVNELAEQVANSAATADPSKQATVQGQLEGLMQQFEGGNTPAWAAGAIRNANAVMAQRGITSSSIAGQAVLQAAMESALPIAQADASTYATFEMQNLSNRQQAAMLAAQQRAQFLQMDFDQNFQSKVANAAKITEIANKNYDASVQIALENANLAQSVDLANLSAKNAKILADAAAMTQIQTQNLSNAQQAALQNAQSFLQMDLANLDNEQQTALFKAQQIAASIMSDGAAENATRQFNATSQNQTNQFMSQLQSQIEEFNVNQKNAMEQFNVGEANALAQFKTKNLTERQMFNANNRLVVDQANAAWRQQVSTNNNATQNEANRINAQNATNMTIAEYNNMFQARRDVMSWSLTIGENAKDRATQIVVAQMSANAAKAAGKQSSKNAMWGAAGSIIGSIFG